MKIDHFEKFKEYSAWKAIGCSTDLEMPNFERWLDEIPESEKPLTKFALFFQVGIPEKKFKRFFNAFRERFPDSIVKTYREVTADEMASIIAFCNEFNGETEID